MASLYRESSSESGRRYISDSLAEAGESTRDGELRVEERIDSGNPE